MGPSKKLLLLLVASLAGCATNNRVADTADSEAYANRLIADKVAVAAEAQREFAAIMAEDKDMKTRKQALFDSDEIDVDYIGKPQQLLETIAHRYGFKYVESGKRLELSTINLRMRKTAPVEVLRNIGNQVDFGANVVLDKDESILRLVYKNR